MISSFLSTMDMTKSLSQYGEQPCLHSLNYTNTYMLFVNSKKKRLWPEMFMLYRKC